MKEWRKWNHKCKSITLDFHNVLSEEHYQAVCVFAGAGSNCRYTLMAVLTTINFTASLSGMKVLMGRFQVNLNTLVTTTLLIILVLPSYVRITAGSPVSSCPSVRRCLRGINHRAAQWTITMDVIFRFKELAG